MWLHNMRDPDLSKQSDVFPIFLFFFFAKLLASSLPHKLSSIEFRKKTKIGLLHRTNAYSYWWSQPWHTIIMLSEHCLWKSSNICRSQPNQWLKRLKQYPNFYIYLSYWKDSKGLTGANAIEATSESKQYMNSSPLLQEHRWTTEHLDLFCEYEYLLDAII